MKILYHHRIRSKDGQPVHLEELIGALRELGHDVLLVGPQDFALESFGHEPTHLQRLKKLLPAYAYEFLELYYNIIAFARLYRTYKEFRSDFIYERCNLLLLARIWLKNVVGVPLLLEVNAPLARERASYGGLGLRRLAGHLERWVWRSADFVLPVEYCSPLKLFEYMEMGKAIVAPDQPNIREISADDVSCLFFTPGVRGSLANAILRLARDDELPVRLGRNAKSLVDERGYTWRHNAERVAALGTASLSRTSEIAR